MRDGAVVSRRRAGPLQDTGAEGVPPLSAQSAESNGGPRRPRKPDGSSETRPTLCFSDKFGWIRLCLEMGEKVYLK